MRILLLTLLLGGLFSCGPEEYTWNQRMTLVVETPDGIVTGSSVIEVTALYCPEGCGLAGDIEVNYSYRGEVVALEVLPGQWLFTLFGNEAERMYRASPDRFGGIPRRERGLWLAATPEQTEPVVLTGDWRPRLVTFEDIEDPWTALEVDPNNLAAIFGEGARLVEVTLAVTRDETVPGGIIELIPSLGEFRGDRLVTDVDPFDFSFPTTLRTRHFIWR